MGVYLSFPFCAQKCTYCNFASGVQPKDLEGRYLQALQAEMALTAWPWTPETLYLGGGTPSSLSGPDLTALVGAVPGAPWREATLEAAPGSLTRDRVTAWRDAGITRVSLGVQSFVDAEIRRTGRKHTAEGVAADVSLLRDLEIPEINIDLIAGLAAQTEAGWRTSLDWLERLDVPHVSVYMLEVDEDSRLGKELMLGGVRYGALDVPSESAIVSFYELALERLAGMGLARYEISNFARPGHESLHNLKYWRLEPYFGFGSDAHSFDGASRWQNVETAAEYVARWEQGMSPRVESQLANPAEERFFVGLRLLEGIEPTAAEWDIHSAAIRKFVEAGLLESDGRRLRLSSRGVLLSNEVFEEFITIA